MEVGISDECTFFSCSVDTLFFYCFVYDDVMLYQMNVST